MARVEQRLAALLSQTAAPPRLAAAMQGSVLGGGKRLRPAVLLAVAEQKGPARAAALEAACAVELIHCYSLVHDDMPCMDNDDTRRGAPACHRAHGEGMALLAGDCLQSAAFEALAAAALPPQAVGLLAAAAGAAGMGGGQALDIGNAISTEAELETMHRLKTGALFGCALQLGLLCRTEQASREEQQAVDAFGSEFGLLFQIANDIKDEKKDRDASKITYATLLPVEEIAKRAQLAKARALAAVQDVFPRLADITHAVYP